MLRKLCRSLKSWLSIGAVWAAISFLIFGCGAHPHSPNQPVQLIVSAAISMKEPLDKVAHEYEKQNPGLRVVANYGGSGTLEHQIEQGAPVDIFISAAEKQMDELQKKQLIEPGTRRDFLANELVLIAPANAKLPRDFADLEAPSVKTVAIGEPRTVPAGEYAEQTLQALHLLPRIAPKIVYAKDVRAVLEYVETGNASAGFVYVTDARISKQVRIVAAAPANSHALILYPAAVLQISKSPQAARAFLEFLESPPSMAIFEQYGFRAPSSTGSSGGSASQ